jgi:hypothetical protein
LWCFAPPHFFAPIEKPGKIIEEYYRSAKRLKEELFSSNAINASISHHKIIALCIRSFLKYKPFYLDSPSNKKDYECCLLTKLPNEYFSLVYISAIFSAFNNDFDGTLVMVERDRFDFIKLLYRYEKDIDSLDPLTLSYIINLIEQTFFLNKLK